MAQLRLPAVACPQLVPDFYWLEQLKRFQVFDQRRLLVGLQLRSKIMPLIAVTAQACIVAALGPIGGLPF